MGNLFAHADKRKNVGWANFAHADL